MTAALVKDWLADLREAAKAAYAKDPGPAKTSEVWKRTPFARFAGSPPVPAPGADVVLPALDGSAGVFIQRDGSAAASLDPALAAKGVELSTLEEAVRGHAGLVRRHLEGVWGGEEERKLESANRAAWTGGAFLLVPKGVRLEAPIRIAFERDRAGAVYPRVLALFGEGSEASVVEEHRSAAGAHLSIGFTRLVLEKGARASIVYQQELGPEARSFSFHKGVVGEGAELSHVSVLLGGRLHKSHVDTELAGRRARAVLYGLNLARGEQHFDYYPKQWHRAPNSSSDLTFRSALRDRSRAVYNGLIRIEEEARGTEAFQTDCNLLLSDHARADSMPILEILTDEVACKHGATAGPLDPEELFYLATRGFSRDQAVRTLVMGFFEPVLKRLTSSAERQRIAAILEARL